MRTQWTTKGNRDAGCSCSCDGGLHRYLRNFGGGGVWTSPNHPLRYATVSDMINPCNRNVRFVSYTSDSLFNNKKTCFLDRLSHFSKFHCNDTKAYRITASPNSSNIDVSWFCLLYCFHTIVLQESVQYSIASCEVPILFYNHNTHTPFVLA